MFMRKISTAAQRHLHQYNPFVEFKTDIRQTMDKHIQMTNMILKSTMSVMTMGFGALGGGLVMLYQKTETDKKDLNDKIDHNTKELNTKMDLILTQISKPKNSWF